MTSRAPHDDEPSRVRTRLTPQARRQQIIEEATRLISRSGFNAVSLNDIAEACGIRKSSVLHYFPAMTDLLTAVLAQRDLDEYESAALLSSPISPTDLRAHLRRVVQRNIEMPEIVTLFAVLSTEAIDPRHPAHRFFAERTRLALDTMSSLLGWKPDPAIAARQLIAFWQGLETLWIADPGTEFLPVWDAFCEDFFPG
ncbi:MAG: TetR/AcrR family transcriptional regulator [Mycobacterium sp.]